MKADKNPIAETRKAGNAEGIRMFSAIRLFRVFAI